MLWEISLFFIFIYLFYLYLQDKPRKNLPPGPTGVPILGYMPFLRGKISHKLVEVSKKYGPVFSLKMGPFQAVVLNDYKSIREGLKDDAFSGRPEAKALKYWGSLKTEEAHGIFVNQGPMWQEQRRFTMRLLRDFGFGTRSMEQLIVDEVQVLMDRFREMTDKPVSMDMEFHVAVLNSLWMIVTGKRFEAGDTRLMDLLERLQIDALETSFTGLHYFFPALCNAFPKLSGWKKVEVTIDNTANYMKEQIEEHKKTYDEGHLRDLTDAYLKEVFNTTDPDSGFYGKRGERNLTMVLMDLFVAGADTTSTTLSWACLYLINHPEVQKKLQREVDQVVGNSRMPTLEDKPNMPYMEATLSETSRRCGLVPVAVLHLAVHDTVFRGYDIPKNTVIIPNLDYAMNDPSYWGDPQNFRPERFLDETEKVVKREEAFMPFSIGKRQCLGENLARAELFLFMTALIQNFELCPVPNEPLPTMHSESVGVVVHPTPFKLILKKRQ